ncbi:MAG: transporter related [Acidimicrobiales bacterium]|jgi:ABC-type branched-subunit amino acid transport system ATPase component|nr:transporter related [Acidimicrobiales bacterium]
MGGFLPLLDRGPTLPGRGRVTATAVVAPLLEVRGIDAAYGPLQVLFDVSLDVAVGGRTALLGTNGAGKSTLLKVVSGLVKPTAGTVRYGGRELASLSASARARAGMVQIAGGRATFPSLTVLDNLRVGAYPFIRDRKRVASRLEAVLEQFPMLRARLGQVAGTLSGGEQQIMALGRALVAGPELLLVDELSLGLAPVVMQDVLAMVDELTRRGTALLLVEQSLNVALGITDHAYFMERGSVRFSGPTGELLERTDLVRSVFFGTASPGGSKRSSGSAR